MSGKIAAFKSKFLTPSEAIVQEASTERLRLNEDSALNQLMLLDSLAIIALMGHMVK